MDCNCLRVPRASAAELCHATAICAALVIRGRPSDAASQVLGRFAQRHQRGAQSIHAAASKGHPSEALGKAITLLATPATHLPSSGASAVAPLLEDVLDQLLIAVNSLQ
jgi:hypothetical protein